MRKILPLVTLAIMLLAGSGNAQSQSPTPQPARVERLAANAAEAMAKYLATLKPVLAIYERELTRQTELAERRKDLYERGELSAHDFEQGQRALAVAQKNVDDTLRAMAEADRLLTEARLAVPLKISPRGAIAPTPQALGIIRYTPGRPIIAVVRLNGRSTARLILDTGADGSMVKPKILAAAGVDLSRPAARGEASGITGKVQVSYFTVEFEVAGHRARVTQVASFDTYENGFADGLLGRDFLDRFKVVMDPAAGIVTLVPR